MFHLLSTLIQGGVIVRDVMRLKRSGQRADGGGLAPEVLLPRRADGRLRKLGGNQARALVLYFALSEA